jgi:RimJ/RimL family protein N-acetyltransferase
VLSLPPEEIITPTIILRRYYGDELPALLDAVDASVAHLKPWMPWASANPLEPNLEDFITRSVEQFERGENFSYAIWNDSRNTLIGGTGLHPRLGPGRLEIGYWVRVGWLRRGVATSAARALTSAAFQMPDIDEVQIHCDKANSASAAVPRRLGFRLLRMVNDEATAPGEVGVSMEWAITRSEWLVLEKGS